MVLACAKLFKPQPQTRFWLSIAKLVHAPAKMDVTCHQLAAVPPTPTKPLPDSGCGVSTDSSAWTVTSRWYATMAVRSEGRASLCRLRERWRRRGSEGKMESGDVAYEKFFRRRPS